MPFFTTSDNVSLHYRICGTGSPILFVHGNNLSSQCWEYHRAQLAERGHLCIAFDRRGFGRSDIVGEFTYDRLSDDIDELVSHLRLSNVTLVGHSIGCGEIARFVARHGTARISAAVLVATVTPFMLLTRENEKGLPPGAMQTVIDRTLEDRPAYFAASADAFFGPRGVSPQTLERVLDMCMETELWSSVVCARLGLSHESDFRSDLSAFAIPTLLVHGKADSFSPLEISMRPTAEQIPGAKAIVYDDAAHGLLFTHKERLVQDIAGFVGT